jgi:hypothetical protein
VSTSLAICWSISLYGVSPIKVTLRPHPASCFGRWMAENKATEGKESKSVFLEEKIKLLNHQWHRQKARALRWIAVWPTAGMKPRKGSKSSSRDTATISRKGSSVMGPRDSSSQILFNAKTDACASPPHHSWPPNSRVQTRNTQR